MSNDHSLPDAKPDAKPDATSDAKPDAKPDATSDATSDAKPVVKYPETNAGYKLWVDAKKEAEEAAKREAENRVKSTVHVLHWKDLRIYDPPSGKKFFLTRDAALKWAKEHFEEWDAFECSLVNTGMWKIVPTDSEGIVEFDPFFWDYSSFKKIWWDDYNYNDDYFYVAKEWDEDDEEKEIAKAIAKILRSEAFNLGLGLKLSMRNCGVELADKSV